VTAAGGHFDEISGLDATELVTLIRSRRLSPVEVVDAMLDRIEALEGGLNAFTQVLGDEARRAASEAERAVTSGQPLGALHGLPIAFKDVIDTAGVPTTLGSPLFRDRVPATSAVIVERSLGAGAILLGKTQMAELTHSAHTSNPLYGTTRNPWAAERTAGGSSGGAAAAVAAGMVPVADASDGGGSIRIPAACCGCFGLKPQFGRIPAAIYPTKFDLMTTLGPITRTVRDAALLLSVWAGDDPRDPLSLPAEYVDRSPIEDLTAPPIRVAYVDFNVPVDAEVSAATDGLAHTIEQMGCHVEAVQIEGYYEAEEAWGVAYWSMFAALYGPAADSVPSAASEGVHRLIARGRVPSAVDYHSANVVRSAFYDKVAAVLAEYDFILTPTLTVLPPLASEFEITTPPRDDRAWYLTWPFNLTMHPAAALPAGMSRHGVPIGAQIVARRFAEHHLLAFCARLENVRPWPRLAGSALA
jgi:Asp-tRNA(Asn)/Glu-tRNA(Gln) amidotransferase A subunit family amidase